jgi:CheY-like chemotaxis protein
MSRTVLVADASPVTAQRVEEAVAPLGARVVAVVNAADAAAALERGDVSAVVSALVLPGGNGYDVARLAVAKNPDCLVFLIAGAYELFQADRASSAGVRARLGRPLAAEALRRPLADAWGQPAPEPDVVSWEPPAEGPHVGDERLASFLPRDWHRYPAVRVDPDVVGPAVERAILEVLPVVVESVLEKALRTSPELRRAVGDAVRAAVRDELARQAAPPPGDSAG